MLEKPDACSGCALEKQGFGFAPALLRPGTDILFVGESLGQQEAIHGEPFYGSAGGMLDKLLWLAETTRDAVDIDNVIHCRPPKDWLTSAPWEAGSVSHCTPHFLHRTLESGKYKVVVPLGGQALRAVMRWPNVPLRKLGVRVEHYHATVQRDPTDSFWVVPTYHPSYLQRGAHNLIGTVVFDIKRSMEVARDGWVGEPMDLFIDPGVEWFSKWVDDFIAAVDRGEDPWLAVDIETPDKEKQVDEGELTTRDRSYTITRVNLCHRPDQGVTVPFSGPYIALIRRLLATTGVKCLWNAPYDQPRLHYHECPLSGPVLDFMDAWHMLRSDEPRSLGYVAPFYSGYGPWKHLNKLNPAKYACIDGPQTLRCSFGIAEGLHTVGMWDRFMRHMHDLKTVVFQPGEAEGVAVDKPELEEFQKYLKGEADQIIGELQKCVPDELLPLYPKDGLVDPIGEPGEKQDWVVKKDGKELHTPITVVVKTVTAKVRWCRTCGAEGIVARHRCKDEKGKPSKTLMPHVVEDEKPVQRWFRRAPFNPASPKQIMAYILSKGHKPGKDKKSGKESTNKDSLQALKKKTKDPFYENLLLIRVVAKMKGTYVDGTLTRLQEDPRSIADGRIHTTHGFRPSTQRTDSKDPNMQNVSIR